MIRSAFAAGFAFAIGVGAIPSAQAGLLDFLFGPHDEPQAQRPERHPVVNLSRSYAPAYYERRYVYEPRRAPRPERQRRIVRVKVPPQPAMTPTEQLAATIDPAKNPRWYLEDRTLRKGDILVLNDRVVVFKGGKVGEAASYVALKQTRLLTAKERARVAAMTTPEKSNPAVAATTPDKPRRPVRSAEMRPRDGLGS